MRYATKKCRDCQWMSVVQRICFLQNQWNLLTNPAIFHKITYKALNRISNWASGIQREGQAHASAERLFQNSRWTCLGAFSEQEGCLSQGERQPALWAWESIDKRCMMTREWMRQDRSDRWNRVVPPSIRSLCAGRSVSVFSFFRADTALKKF